MLKDRVDNVLANVKNYNPVVVVATKYVDTPVLRELLDLGINNFGENRSEPFIKKYNDLKDENIVWHFIGNLQSKKVKDIINKIDYLHSLNRISLANEIEKCANKVIKCFVEVNVSSEESKQGIPLNMALDFINTIKDYKKIEVVGLMTMAPNTDDVNILRNTFNGLKELMLQANKIIPTCNHLSMGMSNDYLVALECGADFIRVGSTILRGE